MPQNLQENLLAQLRKYTVVVADTGDIDVIKHGHPDTTTRSSLITTASPNAAVWPV